MFYVGPAISPLAVFKNIAQSLGWYINTPLYIFAVTLGAFIMFLPQYLFAKKKNKDKSLEAENIENREESTIS
jgi:hypothetical protein